MYKNDDSIVIAKMNSMGNELEHTKITRFPTFKLYQKGDNKVLPYSINFFVCFNIKTIFQVITFKGQLTLNGFSEFIDAMHKKKSVSYLISYILSSFLLASF